MLTGNVSLVDDSSTRGVRSGVKQTASAARYEKRIADGDCTRCPEHRIAKAVEGSQYCAPCGRRERRYQREAKAARRDARRNKGLCVDCAKKSETYRCLPCAIRAGKAPRSGVQNGVKQRGRTDVITEADGYARDRYVGRARRGAPTAAIDDAQDLKSAMTYVQHAVQGQAAVVAAKPSKEDQDAAEMAWMTKLAQAVRFADDILDRRRFDKRRTAADPERMRQVYAMRGKMGGR